MSFFIQWAKTVTGSLPAPGLCKVIQVKDGDSFVIEQDSKIYEIRLSGIDAPELSQAHGIFSQMYLSDMLYKQTIFINPIKFGKYRRIIASAFYENMCVATNLISSGNVWVYEKYAPDCVLHFWMHLQDVAQDNGYGLFKNANAIHPSKYRRSTYS
jgi:endonuclease YncB( thermonuclease family)